MQIELFSPKYEPGFLHRAWRVVGVAAVSVLLTFSLTPIAEALEMTSLYSVEVPFDAEDPDRKNAYRTALSQVLIRITGTTAAAESPELAGQFGHRVTGRVRNRKSPAAIWCDGVGQ